jgi:hypothetical protein
VHGTVLVHDERRDAREFAHATEPARPQNEKSGGKGVRQRASWGEHRRAATRASWNAGPRVEQMVVSTTFEVDEMHVVPTGHDGFIV